MSIKKIKQDIWELVTDCGQVFFLRTKKECLKKVEQITKGQK